MKATLKLELIGGREPTSFLIPRRVLNAASPGMGDTLIGKPDPLLWVAEIVGTDAKYGYARRFLRGDYDYSHANAKGTRGIFVWFLLESGRVYDVKSPFSWSRTERYFCRVTSDGDIEKISQEDVEAWLEECWA
ncbi:MAG: hypothetical protein WC277_08445 [Bacilli bacterium]|jgi:hypothetical protein